jgi:methylenetetrahydrofolate dehydrogenase (NADP+)/methenyltetrahydrofolate cyclohydrolase
MANIIDGKEISKQLKEELAREVEHLKQQHGKTPGLAVVLVGDDPASASYVKSNRLIMSSIHQ